MPSECMCTSRMVSPCLLISLLFKISIKPVAVITTIGSRAERMLLYQHPRRSPDAAFSVTICVAGGLCFMHIWVSSLF